MATLKIQVAFETTPRQGLEEAIGAVLRGGASYIEVGTPLLKSSGVTAIQEARALTPPGCLYADSKTIDFPELELVSVREAGADIATMLAIAADEALEEGRSIAQEVGLKLVVSTMGFPEALLEERVTRIRDLGLDRFVAHGTGKDPLRALRDCTAKASIIHRVPNTTLLVGGGLSAQTVGFLAPLEPAVAIIGRAVTQQADLEAATRKVCAGWE